MVNDSPLNKFFSTIRQQPEKEETKEESHKIKEKPKEFKLIKPVETKKTKELEKDTRSSKFNIEELFSRIKAVSRVIPDKKSKDGETKVSEDKETDDRKGKIKIPILYLE